MRKNKKPDISKLHWYDQCAAHVLAYKKMETENTNEAYEVVNNICKILEKYGFMDADWYTENERMK